MVRNMQKDKTNKTRIKTKKDLSYCYDNHSTKCGQYGRQSLGLDACDTVSEHKVPVLIIMSVQSRNHRQENSEDHQENPQGFSPNSSFRVFSTDTERASCTLCNKKSAWQTAGQLVMGTRAHTDWRPFAYMCQVATVAGTQRIIIKDK